MSNNVSNVNIGDSLISISSNINDLKIETQVANLKIQKLEESIFDIREVLTKLTDVYHQQTLLQKDISQLTSEISAIRKDTVANANEIIPIKNTIQTQISNISLLIKIGGFLSVLFYSIGGFVWNYYTGQVEKVENNIKAIERRIDVLHEKQETHERIHPYPPKYPFPYPRTYGNDALKIEEDFEEPAR